MSLASREAWKGAESPDQALDQVSAWATLFWYLEGQHFPGDWVLCQTHYLMRSTAAVDYTTEDWHMPVAFDQTARSSTPPGWGCQAAPLPISWLTRVESKALQVQCLGASASHSWHGPSCSANQMSSLQGRWTFCISSFSSVSRISQKGNFSEREFPKQGISIAYANVFFSGLVEFPSGMDLNHWHQCQAFSYSSYWGEGGYTLYQLTKSI